MRSHASPRPYVVRRLNPVTVLSLLALPVFVAFEAFSELPAPTWFAVPKSASCSYGTSGRAPNACASTPSACASTEPAAARTAVAASRARQSPGPRSVPSWSFSPTLRAPVDVGETVLGVRLEPGAPLPAGVPAVVYDPRRPGEVPEALRLPVRGWRLDHRQLAGAVSAYGGGVPLVESRGGSERRLTHPEGGVGDSSHNETARHRAEECPHEALPGSRYSENGSRTRRATRSSRQPARSTHA